MGNAKKKKKKKNCNRISLTTATESVFDHRNTISLTTATESVFAHSNRISLSDHSNTISLCPQKPHPYEHSNHLHSSGQNVTGRPTPNLPLVAQEAGTGAEGGAAGLALEGSGTSVFQHVLLQMCQLRECCIALAADVWLLTWCVNTCM